MVTYTRRSSGAQRARSFVSVLGERMSTLAQSLVTPVDAERFHTEGYHIARALLSPDEVREIREAFMDISKDGPVDGLSEVRRRNGVTYNPNDPLSRYPRMM